MEGGRGGTEKGEGGTGWLEGGRGGTEKGEGGTGWLEGGRGGTERGGERDHLSATSAVINRQSLDFLLQCVVLPLLCCSDIQLLPVCSKSNWAILYVDAD